VRSRLIVAIAALIAASALVAGPGVVGARISSSPSAIDPAEFRAVTIAPTPEPLVTANPPLDIANRSAGWLEPDTPLAESDVSPSVAGSRPTRPQPIVAAGRVPKNPWHLDPNISWYGPGMYGGRTACGVTLTTSVMGVASRTLPCGAQVTFRNPATGRTVTVPVIDRGPFVSGRIWDMTGGLCTYLSHCYTGSMFWKLAG
jgi:hypothetical protein